MRKALAAFLLCCLLSVTDADALSVGALRGPTAMGLAKYIHDGGKVTLAGSPDALVPLLARGELDVALLPANLAAALYQHMDGAIRAVNVNTLGRLCVLRQADSSVTGLSDLAGKTLYAAGRASTPEYALSALLELYDVQGVAVEWKSEHAEAAAAFLADEDSLALLPEPFVSAVLLRSPEARLALDVSRLWEEAGLGTLVTGVTVARSDIVESRREELRAFLDLQHASQAYVTAHPDEAAAWMEQQGILSADVARPAIPLCGIAFIARDEMRTVLDVFYMAMYLQNPDAVGGRAPDAAFYAVP